MLKTSVLLAGTRRIIYAYLSRAAAADVAELRTVRSSDISIRILALSPRGGGACCRAVYSSSKLGLTRGMS